MRARATVLALIVVAALLPGAVASAQPPKGPKAPKPPNSGQRFMASPFEFVGAAGDCGPGSPAGDDTVVAAWVTHEGLPDAGKSDHALLLQKAGATANCAAAKVMIMKVHGITLSELGYDVRNDGDCAASAPRFEVVMTDGLHTVGCAVGTVTQTLTDRRGQTWSRKRWNASDLANGALASPPITAASGTVVSITIVFDDGEDASPDAAGRTFLDNVDVNGTLMGKPGLAKPPAP